MQDICTIDYNTTITSPNIAMLGLANQLGDLDVKFPTLLIDFIFNKTDYLKGEGMAVLVLSSHSCIARLALYQPHGDRAALGLLRPAAAGH